MAMTEKVKRLVRDRIDQGQDNLQRAKSAARGRDVNAQWGESGKTLAQIIESYEADIKEWQNHYPHKTLKKPRSARTICTGGTDSTPASSATPL